MTKPIHKYRVAFDGDPDAIAALCTIKDFGESLTQQSFSEDADINVIVRRYGLDNAKMPVAPIDPRYYGDFTDVPDLRTALDIVRDAENRFMDLPAALRSRFDNSAAKLWDFVSNPANAEESVRLGLLARQEENPMDSAGGTPPAPPKTDSP